MMIYARWPKSSWYVYDVLDTLHIMSLNHPNDAPVRIHRVDVVDVDIEYLVECFPGSTDEEINELLACVTAYSHAESVVAEPEVPVDVTPEPTAPAPKKRGRKPKLGPVATKPEAAVVVEIPIHTTTPNKNGDAFPGSTTAPAPVEPKDSDDIQVVGIGADLMPDW